MRNNKRYFLVGIFLAILSVSIFCNRPAFARHDGAAGGEPANINWSSVGSCGGYNCFSRNIGAVWFKYDLYHKDNKGKWQPVQEFDANPLGGDFKLPHLTASGLNQSEIKKRCGKPHLGTVYFLGYAGYNSDGKSSGYQLGALNLGKIVGYGGDVQRIGPKTKAKSGNAQFFSVTLSGDQDFDGGESRAHLNNKDKYTGKSDKGIPDNTVSVSVATWGDACQTFRDYQRYMNDDWPNANWNCDTHTADSIAKNLVWFCGGDATEPKNGAFYSKSQVENSKLSKEAQELTGKDEKRGPNDKSTGTIELGATETQVKVDFSHRIRINAVEEKMDIFKKAKVSTKFVVEQQIIQTGQSLKDGKWQKVGSQGSGLEKATDSEIGVGKLSKMSDDNNIWNAIVGRNEQTRDYPLTAGEINETICQRIVYEKDFTVDLDADDKPTGVKYQKNKEYSQVCVKVHRPKGPESVQGSFYSQSGVNQTTSNKDQVGAQANPYTITLSPDQDRTTVTFFHKIGSDVSSDVFDKASRAGAYTDWTISQTNYQSNSRVSSGRTYIGSLSQDGSTRNQVVYSNSVAVSVAQRQTVTVCQRISYTTKSFTITSGGAFSPTNNSGASSICIRIYRPPVPRRCSEIFPGQYDHTTYYGNTVAKSEAINYTNTTGYATWKGMVLAKPGDEIQFRHTLCFGAQDVTSSGYESSSYENTRRRPSTSFSYFPANWFYLSGYRDDDYLFNRNDLAYTKEIPKANSNPTSFYNQIHPEEIFTDYGFRLYSPKNPSVPGGATSYSNNQYNCALYGSGWTGGFLPNTYQIPGFSYSKCPRPGATDVAVNNSDVGNSVAQTMWYLNLKAWIEYQHNRTNASCGCDTNNEAYSWSLSYSSARSGGWGSWGYARQDCLPDGTCSCNCYYRDSCYSSTNGWYGCNWKCDTCKKYKQDHHYNGPSTRDNDVGYDDVGYELALDYYTDTTTATVKVPYNFDTEVKAEITGGDGVGGAIYAGEQVRSSTEIKVKSRLNRRINGDYAYLTHTPSNTRTEVISFTIGGDLDSATASSLLKGGVVSASSVSDYYNRRLGTYGYKLRSFLTTPYTGIVNGEGQLNGEVEAPGTGRWSEPIPDIEVGSKYCVAVGISHADSHGLPNQMIPNDENSAANSLSMGGTNPLWRISSASCRTIAKKPNFQAWGGLYAQGKVATSRSPKRDADSKAVARVITRLGGDAGKLFGSWSDTLAIAGGQITGLASGATLGYNNTGGGADPASLDSNYCALTPMSIANKYCSSRVSGSVGNIPISTTSLLDRIASRYTLKNNPSSGTTQLINDGNVLYSYYRGNKNITSSDVEPGSFDKKTRVIKVDGNITISSNICVENNGTCRYTGNNSLVLDQRNHRLYSGAEELSQVIIIASGNISISPDVTQIDAWLFANNGVINTCSAANYLSTNANTCNKTIIFNGPVFAKKLELNRTAGAYPGPNDVGAATIYNDLASSDRWFRNNESMTSNLKYGSLTPAEIFNLRPDVYYWGYNQSNRLTQATVTYIRELAPRY